MDELIKYGTVNVLPTLDVVNNHYSGTKIVVVGCGGTGGRLIPLLAQHVANHNKTLDEVSRNNLYIKNRMFLHLIDMDIVETKNLLRQNFIASDVTRNKAEVMAERMSVLFGINVSFSDKPVSQESCFPGTNSNAIRNIIYFDCTDNLAARKALEEVYFTNTSYNSILISCGNESDFGQVLISCKPQYDNFQGEVDALKNLISTIEKPDMKNKGRINQLPTLLSLFRGFKDTVAPSCTEVQLVADQSMPINSLVSQLAFNAFYTIVAGLPLKYNMVKCSINNTFETNMLTHPKKLRDMLFYGSFGVAYDEDTAKNFAELSIMGNLRYLSNGKEAIAIIEKYGRIGAVFIEEMFIPNSWRCQADELIKIKALIEASKVSE